MENEQLSSYFGMSVSLQCLRSVIGELGLMTGTLPHAERQKEQVEMLPGCPPVHHMAPLLLNLPFFTCVFT